MREDNLLVVQPRRFVVTTKSDKWDITGSENLLFGKGFGITTDIQTGPNGHLFVVSLSKGAIFEIFPIRP